VLAVIAPTRIPPTHGKKGLSVPSFESFFADGDCPKRSPRNRLTPGAGLKPRTLAPMKGVGRGEDKSLCLEPQYSWPEPAGRDIEKKRSPAEAGPPPSSPPGPSGQDIAFCRQIRASMALRRDCGGELAGSPDPRPSVALNHGERGRTGQDRHVRGLQGRRDQAIGNLGRDSRGWAPYLRRPGKDFTRHSEGPPGGPRKHRGRADN